jgi:hypothetical protein
MAWRAGRAMQTLTRASRGSHTHARDDDAVHYHVTDEGHCLYAAYNQHRAPCPHTLLCERMLSHVVRRCAAASTAPRGLMPAAVSTSVRALNVHEYQGAELMAKYGINVPPGVAVKTPAEAVAAAATMEDASGEVVVKSQVRPTHNLE